MTYDTFAQACCSRHPIVRLSWWLMAGYAYYALDDPILSDGAYDALGAEILLDGEKAFERHPHVELFPWDSEQHSPSGHDVKYPERVAAAVQRLRQERKC